MNTRDSNTPQPPFDPARAGEVHFDDPRTRSEWDAQERALREERLGVPVGADARVAEYRLLARALRHPPLDAVPYDFAAQVARRAAAGPAFDERLEGWLLRGLVALFALAAIAVVGAYGAAWWPSADALADVLPDGAGTWASAVIACIALSWLMQGVLRQIDAGPRDGAPAA